MGRAFDLIAYQLRLRPFKDAVQVVNAFAQRCVAMRATIGFWPQNSRAQNHVGKWSGMVGKGFDNAIIPRL